MARSLLASFTILKNVFVFLMFFYLFFGILGVQFFRGSMSRRCVIETIQDNTVSNILVFPTRSCGSYLDSNGIPQATFGTSSLSKGYTCPLGQICKVVDVSNESPIGIASFDNIFLSMFTIFQSVTQQGWTQTMYITMDAEFQVAALYHVFVMLVIQLILMNMFIAVIASSFSDIRAEYEETLKIENR